ncbi:MAG: hypothetical protein EON61_03555 [Alphaproteobacteria bacterium]|jgi:hypothetical protein|nr:MAG: hypothetical protein EON61_03555 [Alphaproteobacteria bacterium]
MAALTSKKRARNVASVDARLGNFRFSTHLAISAGGLLRVSALVGVILAGTTGIVWVATTPARPPRRHRILT